MATTTKTSTSKSGSKTTSGTRKTRPSTATSTAAPSPEAPKPVRPAKPVLVTDAPVETGSPELKKQELLDKVVTRSGTRKKFAKPVLEAMLEVLGETLAEGRELNLPPLGKVKLNRTKEGARARVIVAKVRQSKQGNNILPADGGEENDTDAKDVVADPAKGR